jgi:hypothetical protein
MAEIHEGQDSDGRVWYTRLDGTRVRLTRAQRTAALRNRKQMGLSGTADAEDEIPQDPGDQGAWVRYMNGGREYYWHSKTNHLTRHPPPEVSVSRHEDASSFERDWLRAQRFDTGKWCPSQIAACRPPRTGIPVLARALGVRVCGTRHGIGSQPHVLARQVSSTRAQSGCGSWMAPARAWLSGAVSTGTPSTTFCGCGSRKGACWTSR